MHLLYTLLQGVPNNIRVSSIKSKQLKHKEIMTVMFVYVVINNISSTFGYNMLFISFVHCLCKHPSK